MDDLAMNRRKFAILIDIALLTLLSLVNAANKSIARGRKKWTSHIEKKECINILDFYY